MLQISGHGGGTALTGTLYERGETSPTFRGAPNEDAPYVWVCDEFYEVESGGSQTTIDGREIHVAFESPLPRGFETKDQALAAAKDHIRTQFARVGVPPGNITFEVERDDH